MAAGSLWHRAAWGCALAALGVAACSLRSTDDLQAGIAPAPPTEPPDEPPDECGAGSAVCGGDCVDVTRNEDHCGVCNEPCGTGRCEQGSCLRVESTFAGTDIEAGPDERFYIVEAHRCDGRLRTFDDGGSATLEQVPLPQVAAVAAVAVRPDGRLYFTGISTVPVGEVGPLRVFFHDPEADTTSLWAEDPPVFRELTDPIFNPIAYGDDTLVWAAEDDLWVARTDNDGQFEGDPLTYVAGALTGTRAYRIERATNAATFWLDDAALHRRIGTATAEVAVGAIVDFSLQGSSVAWADEDGDIHVAADASAPEESLTVATGQSVTRLALTVDSVYWTGAGGTLKRSPRDGGAVETLHTDPEFAFEALTTTSNRVYWTASRIGAEGEPTCDSRVYRRRLNAPPLP